MELEQPTTSNFVQYDILPALAGLIEPATIERGADGAVIVRGRLLVDAEQVYKPLRARFERIGYTPFLQEHEGGIELRAMRGVIARRQRGWALNAVLFIATVFTVLWTGGAYGADGTIPQSLGAMLIAGIPFAATLLSILVAHEMGHYVVSVWRGAPASLPFFIPLPPGISFTGTMGAVIVQREPFENRRTLLEVAIAGPLAGLVFAIPLLFYGLATSTVSPPPPGSYVIEGNSLFYAAAKYLVFGQWLPGNGVDVQLNSIAFGAWIGLLVTMLNLLPVGQLDGGHVAYALLGKRAEYIAYGTLVAFLLLGIFVSSSWLVWTILIALMGPRHPAPFNDVVKLRPIHTVLGVIGLVAFVLLFMPSPLTVVQ